MIKKIPMSKALYDEINRDLINALFKHKDKLSLEDCLTLSVNLVSGVIEMTVQAVNMKEPKEVVRAAATEDAINTLKELIDAKTRRDLK